MYDLNQEVWNAQDAIENYQKAIEEDNEAVAQAQEKMELAEQAVENLIGATREGSEAAAAVAEETNALNGVIESAAERVNSLAEAYNEAYNAAYESVTVQYALWDEADKTVATSIGSINQNLESQISYATPEIVHELRDYGDDFAEQVMAVIEGAQADAARRAYQ